MIYLDDLAKQIKRAVPPGLIPEGDMSLLFRLYAVLGLAKGERVDARDVHNVWAAWMQERDAGHASLKPFEELDPETQAADDPYVEAIRLVSRRLLFRRRGS